MNLFAWCITLISLLLVMFIINLKTKECFAYILPVATGGLILTLYVLAFFRMMGLIWIIGLLIVFFCLITYLRSDKDIKSQYLLTFKKFYLNPQSLTITFSILIIAILTKDHISLWWDDLNFWATDAKSLYVLNGFPGKYGNVAPEFGDYPPGVQIMKWCFMKLKSTYDEGLSFSGYYVMIVVFLSTLMGRIKDKNIFFQIPFMCIVLLLPGVCNRVWADGACADICMGVVFGSLLIAIIDNKEHEALFYYLRIAVFLSVLVLCKSSGYQWAIYAVFLLFAIFISDRKNGNPLYIKGMAKYMWISIGIGVSTQLSWWIFCLINRRIAKLTSAGAHMVVGGYSLPDNASEKVSLFIKGFIHYPMHSDFSGIFNLTSLSMFIMLLLVIVLFSIFRIIDDKKMTLLLIYSSVVGILSYLAVLIGHLTIFATETQYDTAEVMAISISRYACPYTIGMLMLVFFLSLDHKNINISMLIASAIILITTDYEAAGYTLYGYRADVDRQLSERAAVVDEDGYTYINTVSEDDELYGHRVLYLRDGNKPHWVKDTYINYYASPVPTVYESYFADSCSTQEVIDMIKRNHASYIYVDPQNIVSRDIFEPLLDQDSFNYATIYEIVSTNEGIRLICK